MTAPTSPDSLALPVGAAVAAVVAALAIALAAPAPHWLDAAELAAAGYELGVAHPPGHPLAMILVKAFTLLPLGGLAFRAACASAVALGVATLLLLLITRRLVDLAWRAIRPEQPLPRRVLGPAAAGATLAAVLGYAALYQAVRAEVYALHLALALGVVLLALRYLEGARRRDLVAGALVIGLGLGNHHLLVLALGPAVLVAVLAAPGGIRAAARHLAPAAAALILGLSVYAYLPLRAAQAPTINWGVPDTPARIAWTVSARLFQRTAARSVGEGPGRRAVVLAATLAREAGPGPVLLALGGIFLLARRRTWPALAVVAGAAAGTAGAAVLAGFEPDNPDALGYVLPALAGLSALAGAGLAAGLALLQRRPGIVLALGATALLLLPLHALAGSARAADLRQAHGAERATDLGLGDLPPGALLATSNYQTGFRVWAAQILEGQRPDVDHVHRSYLGQPGYVANLGRRSPGLARLLAGLRWPGDLGADRLGAEAARRPVLVEFDDATFDDALLGRTLPAGPLQAVLPAGAAAPDPAAAAARSEARLAALWAALEPHRDDPLTRSYLLMTAFLDARYHVRRGHCAAARPSLERARALGRPNDPLLAALLARCGK